MDWFYNRVGVFLYSARQKSNTNRNMKMATKPRRLTARTKGKKETAIDPNQLAGVLIDEPLNKVIYDAMKEFGTYSVEERAIPAFVDGLKPSQRRVLWSMYYALGSRPDKGYLKCARVEGATYQFHPHSSIFSTLVNMVEGTPCPLIMGYGNFGSFSKNFTPPGAARYIECKLSDFTLALLFDKRFEKAYPRVPSFDGSSEEPVFLPAQLPLILALEPSGIAVGTTVEIPAFTIESLYHAVQTALKEPNYKLNAKRLAKILKFASARGGIMISPDADVVSLLATGTGSLEWSCEYAINGNVISITGMPSGWSYDSRIETIRNLPFVATVADMSDRDGIRINITLKKSDEETKAANVAKVEKLLRCKLSYYCNITDRQLVEDELVNTTSSKFSSISIVDLLAKWIEYRTTMEKWALKIEHAENKEALAHQKLMLLATSKLDIIFAILKRKGIDKVVELSKQLKITEEQSKTIWSIAVGRLDRLSSDNIEKKINELNARQKEISALYKNPAQATALYLKAHRDNLTNPIAYENIEVKK